MWSTLFLTLALSLDGFLVGLSYGVRGIVIPGCSLFVISLCTGVGMSLSMLIGGLFGEQIPSSLSHWVGGFVLILVGIWQLWQAWLNSVADNAAGNEKRLLARLRLRLLGVVIEIIKDPGTADRDESGCIDPREAIALGIALGLDTLAAGFAASLAGLSHWLILCVSLGLLVLTWCGLMVGKAGSNRQLPVYSELIPALMLIIIGIWEIR